MGRMIELIPLIHVNMWYLLCWMCTKTNGLVPGQLKDNQQRLQEVTHPWQKIAWPIIPPPDLHILRQLGVLVVLVLRINTTYSQDKKTQMNDWGSVGSVWGWDRVSKQNNWYPPVTCKVHRQACEQGYSGEHVVRKILHFGPYGCW